MNSGQVLLMKNVMQKQQDPLNLQGLPQVPPPRDGWPAIEAALRRDHGRRRLGRYAAAALAAAAVVALALGLVVQKPFSGGAGDTPQRTLQQAQLAAEASGAADPATGTPAPAERLDSLIALSQQLESRLRRIRGGIGDLPATQLVYQVELEDLVVQVDEELSMQPDSVPLWNQRVSLLMDLERLYQNSLRREYRQMASL